MLSLFLMLKSLWVEFSEHKMESFCFLSLTEGTEAVVNLIEDDVWEAKDSRTGSLNEWVVSWG